MTKSVLTRSELLNAISQEIGFSKKESTNIVEVILEEMSNAIIESGNLKLLSFGTFSVKQKNERIGRNPKTGVQTPILPRRVVTFKASKTLRDKMNNVSNKNY